jgi:hypothetical protein
VGKFSHALRARGKFRKCRRRIVSLARGRAEGPRAGSQKLAGTQSRATSDLDESITLGCNIAFRSLRIARGGRDGLWVHPGRGSRSRAPETPGMGIAAKGRTGNSSPFPRPQRGINHLATGERLGKNSDGHLFAGPRPGRTRGPVGPGLSGTPGVPDEGVYAECWRGVV